MTVLATFPKLAHDWLKGETADTFLSRKSVTVLDVNAMVRTGTVMGIVTASGKWRAFNPAASDGSETAAGILINTVDANNDVEGVVLIADAQIVPSQLVWAHAATTNEKNAALASLAAKRIVSHQRG